MIVRYSKSLDQIFFEGVGEEQNHELMADYQQVQVLKTTRDGPMPKLRYSGRA